MYFFSVNIRELRQYDRSTRLHYRCLTKIYHRCANAFYRELAVNSFIYIFVVFFFFSHFSLALVLCYVRLIHNVVGRGHRALRTVSILNEVVDGMWIQAGGDRKACLASSRMVFCDYGSNGMRGERGGGGETGEPAHSMAGPATKIGRHMCRSKRFMGEWDRGVTSHMYIGAMI